MNEEQPLSEQELRAIIRGDLDGDENNDPRPYSRRLAAMVIGLQIAKDLNDSFYRLTVQQRDAAWLEVEALKADVRGRDLLLSEENDEIMRLRAERETAIAKAVQAATDLAYRALGEERAERQKMAEQYQRLLKQEVG